MAEWFDETTRDIAYALRALLRAPGYAGPAIVVLALGIGATTAVFSGATAVLGHLPYPHDEQLIFVFEQNSATNRWSTSVADFQAIAAGAPSLAAVGAVRLRQVPVTTGAEPTSASVALITSGLIRALGTSPALGRSLVAGDDAAGTPLVALASDAFARRVFGGGAGALGRSVLIDGRAHTIIGVWPAEMDQFVGVHVDLWPVLQLDAPTRRGPFGLMVVGRLARGATLALVRRELSDVSVRLLPLWSDFTDRTARLTPYPMRETILGDAPRTLGILAAAVFLVLLIAVANVAGLALVRATGRAHELSLRTALGATRGRLVRLVMTESAVVALAGGVLGLAIGAAALRLLIAIGPYVPRLEEARLDAGAAGFAALVALAAGVVIGAYPLVRLVRADAGASLSNGARSVGGGRGAPAVRSAFVVGEFALALPLLAVAGLLLKSFMRLQEVAPGFAPERLATIQVSLPAARYGDPANLAAFWARALLALEQSPAVVGVGLGDALPPEPLGNYDNFDLLDHPVGDGNAQPVSPEITVSRGYFAALGVPLLNGRLFAPADTGTGPPVLVVSRSWAAHYFPGEDAVGRRLIQGGCRTCPPTTIVGVVGDVKYAGLGATGDAMYNPMEQGWSRTPHLFVRGRDTGDDALGAVRAVLRGLEPAVSLDRPMSMREVVYGSIAQPRHLTTLLMGFALAALGLAAVGVFGLLSYIVAARRREIGLRMALGADPAAVVRMIVWLGVGYAGVGAAIGLLVAFIGTRWIAGALFSVSPGDPVTLLEVTAVLLGMALLACWLPARRAARVDPIVALRSDG